MNTEEVVALLRRVKIVWPHTTWDAPPKLVAEVWQESLDDLPLAAVLSTLAGMSDREFAPPPGVLRLAVLERIDPDSTPDADQAWHEVCQGIRQWGWCSKSEQRKWSHPAVGEAVGNFGWMALCESENPMATRAQFRSTYNEVRARHRPDRTPPAARAVLDAYRDGPRGLPSAGS